MPGRLPLVRAGFLQAALSSSPDLKARLHPSTAWAIERAKRRGWLPMEMDVELADAVRAACDGDDERCRAFWRRTRSGSYRDWLFGPLAGAAFEALVRPATLVRFAPRIWQRVFKNAGALVVEQQGRAGSVLVITGAADPMLRSRTYLSAVAAGIEGGIDATGRHGHCAVGDVDEAKQTVRFRVSWKPDRPERGV